MGTFAKIYFFFAKEPIKIHQNSSLIISSEPITFIPRRKKNECERKITLREKIRIKVVSLFHRKKNRTSISGFPTSIQIIVYYNQNAKSIF